MSWNEECDFGDVKIDILSWTCPRCGHEQDAHGISLNNDVYCKNVKVCGERQAYFWLSICGSYKGWSDLPLETVEEKAK